MTKRNALRCPSCGYNLEGLTELRCPECATDYTPASVRKHIRRDRIRRWLIAACVLLPLFYLPYSWLLFEDGSLIDFQNISDYRGYWLRHYPVLPGLIPEVYLRQFYENETLVMASFTLAFIGSSMWIGSRNKTALIIIAALAGLWGALAFFATQAIYKV